jgi:integrase
MGRRPNPPRGLMAVSLKYAADEYMKTVRAEHPGSSTPVVKQSVMNGMKRYFGEGREVWTLQRPELVAAVASLISGADEKEQEYRRANKMRPRPGRTTKGSQSQVRTAVRQFVEYCHEAGWLAESVYLPAKPKGSSRNGGAAATPKVRFPEEEWPAVIEAAAKRHMRARMATALGLYYARRVSEVVRLQRKHIDIAQQTIEFWNKKAGRNILLPLFPEFATEVQIWDEWARAEYGEPRGDWYLVPARAQLTGMGSRIRLAQDSRIYPVEMGRQSSTESVIKDTRKILAEFGIEKGSGAGTHTFRRSAARVVALKHDLRTAKALLDHAHITTTEAYVGADDAYLLLREKMMPKPDPEPPTPDKMAPDNVVQFRSRRIAS